MRYILFIILFATTGCTPLVPAEKVINQHEDKVSLFTTYCVDGVSYIVRHSSGVMSVKYDKETLLPQRCD